MGRRGPLPESVKLRMVQADDMPVGGRALPAPSWLNPTAKKVWRSLARELARFDRLGKLDEPAFAVLCVAIADYITAREFIDKHGHFYKTPTGYWRPIPQVSLMEKCQGIIREYAPQFAMTPLARMRLAVPGASEEYDPMEELLRSKGKGA